MNILINISQNISVVAVIAADIATVVDSFHRITTATAVAIDLFDGRCSVGAPLTISTVGRDAICGCSWAGHAPVDFQTGRAGGL